MFARISFPDLTADGEALKMDGIVPAYVVKEFPVYVGLIVILGLLSAGLSTLEGLIQSVSSTITSDIIQPLFSKKLGITEQKRSKNLIMINKGVIVTLAFVSIVLSYDQILNPSLSVGIFAQNGVYAYFSAAFVPVLIGIFLKNVPRIVPIAASVTAIIVHFSIYYGGLTSYMKGAVKNPAVAVTFALLASMAVATILFFATKNREHSIENQH